VTSNKSSEGGELKLYPHTDIQHHKPYWGKLKVYRTPLIPLQKCAPYGEISKRL